MPHTILYLVNPEKYFAGILKIARGLSGGTVIYITANKPYQYLSNFLNANGIDSSKYFFIDCVTKQVLGFSGIEPANCVFVKSPQNLTELSVAISECVDATPGEKILLLDSLSTLLFYNDSETTSRFSHFFINKMQLGGIGTVVIALESDAGKDIIQRIKSFSEEVIRI